MTTPRPCADPQDRWRLVRVGTDMLGQFGTRTDSGDRITAEWGEPDDDGIYEPTFTTHSDDNPMREAADLLTRVLTASVRDLP